MFKKKVQVNFQNKIFLIFLLWQEFNLFFFVLKRLYVCTTHRVTMNTDVNGLANIANPIFPKPYWGRDNWLLAQSLFHKTSIGVGTSRSWSWKDVRVCRLLLVLLRNLGIFLRFLAILLCVTYGRLCCNRVFLLNLGDGLGVCI